MKVFAFLSLPFAVGGHNEDASQLSVPGPVELASLSVIGSNTLQTTFSPPLFDGGSPVTSYLVEYDKQVLSS